MNHRGKDEEGKIELGCGYVENGSREVILQRTFLVITEDTTT